MSKSVVRCRCGHQILAKEVLRTDLYERSSGRDYVYVKFRCARCKRLGQIFIAESRWDWSVLESARNELNDAERDRFLDETPISSLECINFRQQLTDVFSLAQLQNLELPAPVKPPKSGDDSTLRAACDSAPIAESELEEKNSQLQDRQARETREREAKERDKEHRGLRNIVERDEDKSPIKKPGSNLPGGESVDDAPPKA